MMKITASQQKILDLINSVDNIELGSKITLKNYLENEEEKFEEYSKLICDIEDCVYGDLNFGDEDIFAYVKCVGEYIIINFSHEISVSLDITKVSKVAAKLNDRKYKSSSELKMISDNNPVYLKVYLKSIDYNLVFTDSVGLDRKKLLSTISNNMMLWKEVVESVVKNKYSFVEYKVPFGQEGINLYGTPEALMVRFTEKEEEIDVYLGLENSSFDFEVIGNSKEIMDIVNNKYPLLNDLRKKIYSKQLVREKLPKEIKDYYYR